MNLSIYAHQGQASMEIPGRQKWAEDTMFMRHLGSPHVPGESTLPGLPSCREMIFTLFVGRGSGQWFISLTTRREDRSIVSSSSGSAQFQHWTHQSAFFLFSPSWAQSALTQPPSVSRALREMVTSRVLETAVIFELMTVYQQHPGAAPNYQLLRSTLNPQRSCSLLWFPVW